MFLVFNVGDVVGGVMAGSGKLNWPGKDIILYVTSSRILIIPLLLMCNLRPRSVPVWFKNDLWPVLFLSILAVSNGHINTLAMSYAPQVIDSKVDKGTAGVIMTASATMGLVLGSTFVFLAKTIIS